MDRPHPPAHCRGAAARPRADRFPRRARPGERWRKRPDRRPGGGGRGGRRCGGDRRRTARQGRRGTAAAGRVEQLRRAARGHRRRPPLAGRVTGRRRPHRARRPAQRHHPADPRGLGTGRAPRRRTAHDAHRRRQLLPRRLLRDVLPRHGDHPHRERQRRDHAGEDRRAGHRRRGGPRVRRGRHRPARPRRSHVPQADSRRPGERGRAHRIPGALEGRHREGTRRLRAVPRLPLGGRQRVARRRAVRLRRRPRRAPALPRGHPHPGHPPDR